MRQIKFRGLRTDGKGWVYGDLMCNWTDPQILSELDGNEYKVIPESVGQFTGRQDINGIDIYEGDNVKRQVYDWKATLKEEERTGDLDLMIYKTEESYIEYRGNGFYVKDEYFGWEGEGLWNWSELEIIGNTHTQDGGQEG